MPLIHLNNPDHLKLASKMKMQDHVEYMVVILNVNKIECK